MTSHDALQAKAIGLDNEDALAGLRDRYEMPEDWIFFDANSVGPVPKTARSQANALIDDWIMLRRRGWAERDWVDAPSIIGDGLAAMIGAGPGEVVVCDNTTVNLYKATGHALSVQEGRNVLLSQAHNFPTDLHVLQGFVAESGGRLSLKTVTTEDEAIAAMSEDIAVASFSHVDYKSGTRWNMARVNAAAREKGVLVIWDVSHSAGAVPVDAHGAKADYIVGCGYKYLSTGPGGPAFIYVRPDLADRAWPPLCGWMGHADIYAFSGEYQPHAGVKRFISGTPMVGANQIAKASADIIKDVDPETLWAKHRSLSEFLIECLERVVGDHGVEVTSPRDSENRGGHVSFRSPGAGHVVEALLDAKVVSSFRKPDSIRFGISALVTSHRDILDAVMRLRKILDEEIWKDPKYAEVSV